MAKYDYKVGIQILLIKLGWKNMLEILSLRVDILVLVECSPLLIKSNGSVTNNCIKHK